MMAVMRRRPRSSGLETVMWATRIALLVAGALSVAAAARAAVPLAAALPRLWSFLRAFLAPPYLFIVVHLIIVVIWKLSDQKHHRPAPAADEKPPPETPPKREDLETPPLSTKTTPEIWRSISPAEGEPGESSPASVASCVTTEANEGSTTSFLLESKKSLPTPPESVGPPPKAPAAEEEEAAPCVGPQIENDTIDDTWRAIMAQSPRLVPVLPERETTPAPAIMGHDEWNRRFEDFIKKNYDQIRLQRHESNQRRLAMANVASH